MLAFYALRNANRRLEPNLVAATALLQSLTEGHPESKTARKAVSADLSDMELRLSRNLDALPEQWVVEHLPFRQDGIVWADNIHFLTNGVRELIDGLAAMRRDLEKEMLAKGDLARRGQPWIERAADLVALIEKQVARIPAQAIVLTDG